MVSGRIRASVLTGLSLLLLSVAATIRQRPMSERIAAFETPPVIRSWEYVDGFPQRIAVFQTVFWEPRDTNSLRELIETKDLVGSKRVLEIGTGSGLVALCCLRAGAAAVTASDVNPLAIENAQYNANLLGMSDRLDLRLVPLRSPSAYSVVHPGETFDVILSNPPWENAQPQTIDQYALYDRDFQLLDSILSGARHRLNPGGRLLLVYGCRDAIRTLKRVAESHDLRVELLDERSVQDLPEVFLPGMLLEVHPRRGPF